MAPASRRRRVLLAALAALALVGAVWAVLAAFFFDVITFRSMGQQMFPNLGPGARVLVNRRKTPVRGDVVVVDKIDGGYDLLRVVAVPGDTVAFFDTRPFVDGVKTTWREIGYAMIEERTLLAQEESLGEQRYVVFDDSRRDMQTLSARKVDGYWLLEDNRDYLFGKDSRSRGALARAHIRGVVSWVLDTGDVPYVRSRVALDAGVAP